jgi:hypothetical protein
MSSFVVENRTIDRIITQAVLSNTVIGKYVRGKIERLYDLNLDTDKDRTKLGAEMLNLNRRATGERYGKDPDTCSRGYRYRPELCSAIATIKAVNCWLYQCSVGETAQSDEYKFWEGVQANLEHDYIQSLPGYQAAKTWE